VTHFQLKDGAQETNIHLPTRLLRAYRDTDNTPLSFLHIQAKCYVLLHWTQSHFCRCNFYKQDWKKKMCHLGVHSKHMKTTHSLGFPLTFRPQDRLPTVQEKQGHKAKIIRKWIWYFRSVWKGQVCFSRSLSLSSFSFCVQSGCSWQTKTLWLCSLIDKIFIWYMEK
jgi:hypothetical protein